MDCNIGRARASETLRRYNLVRSLAEGVVVQTVSSVSIVVIGGSDGTARSLVLAH